MSSGSFIGRRGLARFDGPPLALLAGVLSACLAGLVSRVGVLPLVALGGAAAFAALVLLFRRAPQIAAVIVVLGITVEPALAFFVSPSIGPAKDAVALAGLAALAGSVLIGLPEERRRFDAWLVGAVVLLIALYLVNAAGTHGSAWAAQTRLVTESLGLFLVGYLGDQSHRTWKWTLGALIAAGVLNVLIGIIQQLLGPQRLILDFHYAFGVQVRETAGGQFRSFGTFSDPFSYAELLILALAAVGLRIRRSTPAVAVAALLTLGVVLSFVRTELVLLVIVALVILLRTGRMPSAIALSLAVLVAGLGVLGLTVESGAAGGAQNSSLLSVNGRAAAWGKILRPSADLLAGRGVGAVGEGLTRSTTSTIQPVAHYQPGVAVAAQPAGSLAFVDSTYLTTLAEVGLPGLVLLLIAMVRMARIGVVTLRRGSEAGWAGLAMLTVVAIDAVTRSSMLAFPFGFIAMYAIGVALAAGEADVLPARPDDFFMPEYRSAGRSQIGAGSPAPRSLPRRRLPSRPAARSRPLAAPVSSVYRPLHGLLAALLSRGGSRVFGLVLLVVLARHQSPREFATYSYLLVLAAAASLITDSGIALIAGREVARGQLSVAAAYRSVLPTQLVTCVLSGVAVAVVATAAPGPGATVSAAAVAGVFIFANGILNLQGELLRGAGRPWVEAGLQACAGALQLALGSWVVLSGYGITALFGVLAVQQALMVIAAQCFLPNPWREHSAEVRWKDLLRQGAWLGGASTCLALVLRLPQLLLGNFATVTETAHFAIASRYADLLATVCLTAGFGLLPAMTNRLSSGGAAASIFPRRIFWIATGAALALTPLLVLLTPLVTSEVFGARYAGAGGAAQVIVGSLPLLVALYMSWYALIAHRLERRVLLSGISALAVLGLGVVWIALHATAVAAAETTVAAVAAAAVVATVSLLTVPAALDPS